MATIDTVPNVNSPGITDATTASKKLGPFQMFGLAVKFNNHALPEYILPTHAINMLVLEDDFFEWNRKGYLIYKNANEMFERVTPQVYSYRMDARDEISFELKPLTDPNLGGQKLPEYIWNFNLNSIIYDTEDLPSNNNESKIKKLYFWDKRYQLMLDKKIEWSTANNIPLASLKTDIERSLKTGIALKQLLIAAGFEYDISELSEDWNEGENSIFFSSPADYNVIDCIQYIIQRHISTDKDFSFLRTDRFTNLFKFKSLKSFFKDAGRSENEPGPLQIEHFFLETNYAPEQYNTVPFKAPISYELSFEKDIKMLEWNKISNYQYTDMSGGDNEKILNSKPVYWYDNKNNQFGVDFKINEIQNVKNKFKELYVDNLYPAEKAMPLFTLNQSKTNQYNITPTFTRIDASQGVINPIDRTMVGRLKTLFGGVFLNSCIVLRVLGSTHRLAGTFIAIDSLANEDNEFDKKMCGQWFVINVKHIWMFNKYVNEITAIKIHSYEDLRIEEQIE